MEDEAFILALKAGDTTVFNQMVQIYGKSVLNTCYRFLLDEHDAEDISQEVFIEVFQSIRLFRGDSKLSTWIYRIAVTKCLDELKKRKRKKRLNSLGKLLHLDEVAHWLAGGSMPDKPLKDREKMNELAQALNSLPDNQRIAFTLSKMEGYSNSEIADIMDTSIIAVESLIYRAKKAAGAELKQILKNNES